MSARQKEQTIEGTPGQHLRREVTSKYYGSYRPPENEVDPLLQSLADRINAEAALATSRGDQVTVEGEEGCYTFVGAKVSVVRDGVEVTYRQGRSRICGTAIDREWAQRLRRWKRGTLLCRDEDGEPLTIRFGGAAR
jgi:hypothetical protein